jgi:hypothetical protein
MVYDRLTARYSFSCPRRREEVHVRLSRFRRVQRLPGPAHPAVYDVAFSCRCGDEHDGLVTHEELDWAPVGGDDPAFFNVMTGRLDSTSAELAEQAASNIKRGRWPWCFFCYSEERPQPVYPSAFRLVAPQDGRIVLAARCPACGRTSANVVSAEHLDIPFYSDREIDVVERVFPTELGIGALVEALGAGELETGPRRLVA